MGNVYVQRYSRWNPLTYSWLIAKKARLGNRKFHPCSIYLVSLAMNRLDIRVISRSGVSLVFGNESMTSFQHGKVARWYAKLHNNSTNPRISRKFFDWGAPADSMAAPNPVSGHTGGRWERLSLPRRSKETHQSILAKSCMPSPTNDRR